MNDNPGQPPEGWDDVPEELIARDVRRLFLAYQAAGFTSNEAAMILGAWLAATMTQTHSSA